MKYILLNKNTVVEIISEFNTDFPNIPITERYSPSFLANCIAVKDDVRVEQNWIYSTETKTFAEPPKPEPMPILPIEPIAPSEAEKLRADIDYLALIQGVTL